MKINEWLADATKKLETAGIGTARLDCLVLLADCLSKDKAFVLANQEIELSPAQLKMLDKQLARREMHYPLAYVRGKTEFYGREFVINHHVLEPRPESETMIDLLKEIFEQRAESREQIIIDVGTGSGALAITAKLELPQAEVIATDIDKNCLKVAGQNAQKYDVDITFLHGNLLAPFSALSSLPSALLCNLPYVPDSYTLNEAAMNEPKIAIFGGEDGLDMYRRLFASLTHLMPQFILTESLPFQHAELAKIAATQGYALKETRDFIQVFMIID